eukprot:s3453_g17.t1
MRWSRCMVMAMAAACLMALLGCDDEEVTGMYPECSNFTKNGVAPVTDATTCREACVTAEGLAEVGGSLEDWAGSSGAGKCACFEGTNGYGGYETMCQDSSYSSRVVCAALGKMPRSSRILVSALLCLATFVVTRFIDAAFVAPAVTSPSRQELTALQARGGGEYDISDADIQNFYNSLLTGAGGDPPKGTVLSELIVKFFHGDFTPQGFKRYSGLWKGPPPGNIGKKDIAVGVAKLKEQMANPMFVTKGNECEREDDGKGWVWLAAEMSPGGLAVELFKSVPYGKRALLVAKQGNVDELFQKVNWDTALANVEVTFGGPQVKQR